MQHNCAEGTARHTRRFYAWLTKRDERDDENSVSWILTIERFYFYFLSFFFFPRAIPLKYFRKLFPSDLFHANSELISFLFQKDRIGEKRYTRKSHLEGGIIVKIAKVSKLGKGSGKLCSRSAASMAQFFDQLSINTVICHSSRVRRIERERWTLGCSINHHWFKTSPRKKCDVPPIKFDLPYRGRSVLSLRRFIVCLIFILERRQKNYGLPVGARRRLGTSVDQFLKPRHGNGREGSLAYRTMTMLMPDGRSQIIPARYY